MICQQPRFMDLVDHPLDWWAYGGYPAVMRELQCTKAVARHKVHAKIAESFKRTGDPIWKPVSLEAGQSPWLHAAASGDHERPRSEQ